MIYKDMDKHIYIKGNRTPESAECRA